MPEYDDRNRFVLFRNNNKREGKNDADFKGSFTDESGRKFFLDAWSQTPKNGGEKFLSGKVKLMDKQPEGVQRKPAMAAANLDDDVPF